MINIDDVRWWLKTIFFDIDIGAVVDGETQNSIHEFVDRIVSCKILFEIQRRVNSTIWYVRDKNCYHNKKKFDQYFL